MGVYIPNMKMPRNCVGCEIERFADCGIWQGVSASNYIDKRYEHCPLIEVKSARSSDLISREETIQAIDDYTKGKPLYEYPYQLIEVIRNVPSAEMTGKWKEVQRLYPAEHQSLCECSVCGNTVWVYVGERRWKFCPNCGARMVN